MSEIDLNPQLADLLKNHGVNVSISENFIDTDLQDNVKFKARAIYQEIKNGINSKLDVIALTANGEEIIESFGDMGGTIEEALNNNFYNFSASSLHPMLAAFGCTDPYTQHQVTIEDWNISGKTWKAYIGNLVPKTIAPKEQKVIPPPAFFNAFEQGIKAQHLTNRLHWFRGYYCQIDNEIAFKEFLKDNELITETDDIFNILPVLPNIKFVSCRNFIILKEDDN